MPADVQLLVDEARIGCSMGMLLCLDRPQRLSRARRDLHQFIDGKCGLVNTANPCRCAKKTQAFINAGFVDPKQLLFATIHVTRVRDVAPQVHADVNALDAAYAAVYRDQPFQQPPALAPSRACCSGPSYFDPVQDRRVDGLAAMTAMLAPFTGKIRVDRYDMLAPVVQHDGDVAVLSFNLLSYRTQADGAECVIARWNSTEAYRRTDLGWRIFHNHWSFIAPELKAPVTEGI